MNKYDYYQKLEAQVVEAFGYTKAMQIKDMAKDYVKEQQQMSKAIMIVEEMLVEAEEVYDRTVDDYGRYDRATAYAWQSVETLKEVLKKLKGEL